MSSILNPDKKILDLILNSWVDCMDNAYSMYDYCSDSIKKLRAFIPENMYLVRTKKNNFKYIDQHADIDNKNGEDLLFYVNKRNEDTFILMNPIPKNLKLNKENFKYINNKIWYVLNTDNVEKNENDKKFNEEYYLNENDIIKVGRVKYAVQKIFIRSEDLGEPPGPDIDIDYNISELNKNTLPVFDFVFEVDNDHYNINKNNNLTDIGECKICQKNDINYEKSDEENPLISLCNCKNLIHYKCLKKELNSKKEIKENIKKNVESMIFKNYECPECSIPYPVKFKLPNIDKIFNLIDIKEPDNCDYMILESIDSKKNNQFYKSIHIIKLNQETFSIGRDKDNDIIEEDITISLYQALLKLNNEKICIRNLNKKYGTLVLVKNPIKIFDKAIYLQVGKTYIEARLLRQ